MANDCLWMTWLDDDIFMLRERLLDTQAALIDLIENLLQIPSIHAFEFTAVPYPFLTIFTERNADLTTSFDENQKLTDLFNEFHARGGLCRFVIRAIQDRDPSRPQDEGFAWSRVS